MSGELVDLAAAIEVRRRQWGGSPRRPERPAPEGTVWAGDLLEGEIDRLLEERQRHLTRLAEQGRELDAFRRELAEQCDALRLLGNRMAAADAALAARCPGCGREIEPYEEGEARYYHARCCRRCWKRGQAKGRRR